VKLELHLDDTSARRALAEAGPRARAAWEATMLLRAQDLLDVATERHAPRRTGRLRASRYATITSPVEAGFAVPYAAAVHERHGIGWKFFEKALAEHERDGEAPLARHFEASFAAGTTLASAATRHPSAPNAAALASARPRGRG
jgi:hypothetical protein